MKLLFDMAHWHALAKLRMHNDITLKILQATTISLGEKLRNFSRTTCSAFATKELSREYNARVRREARVAANKAHASEKASSSNTISEATNETNTSNSSLGGLPDIQAGPPPPGQSGRRRKTFNLNTFKGHSLGDYVNTIKHHGTTDSYSTEPVRDLCLLSVDPY
jgi:glutamate synthase domain-containing protein 3